MWINLDEREIEQVLQALVTVGNAALVGVIVDKQKDPENANKYRAAADEKFGEDGKIEFDEDAVVSAGDDPGAYVQGWFWVDNETAGVETEEEDDE